MKTLYFDCFAGASGNMILGGLVALGIDKEKLVRELEKLRFSDFKLEFANVNRAGINAILASTLFKKEHVHRHLSDITKIILESGLSDQIKNRSNGIFNSLALAEARVHGIDIEKVHFHEVGAIDAIIDVVGACIGFEMLEVESFACSKIHTGSGFIEIDHGKYPVPPPAVTELLKGLPVYSTEIEGELITPTGAAIIATVCDVFGAMPEMTIEKTGYGAGSRAYELFPNVLRMIVGDRVSEDSFSEPDSRPASPTSSNLESRNLLLIETNLDDVSPEILGYVMEKGFEMGALDCWFTPIQMKKNRPATMISILCENSKKESLSEMLFYETRTLGVRIKQIERNCLPRERRLIETDFGAIEFKIARLNGKIINVKPEHEDVKRAALESGVSLKEIETRVLQEFDEEEN